MADVNPEVTTPETTPETTKDTTDYGKLLEGVDINKLLEYESVKKLVQAQSDRRVTQAIQTAKAKWQAEQEEAQSEAEKLKKMSAEQQEKYKLELDRKAFEQEKANFLHAQLVVETQKQLLNSGLPDIAEFITGATAEETTANITKVTELLGAWKTAQLNSAMRGTAPKDTTPQNITKLTKADLMTMTPAEINKAWDEGRIDVSNL